MHNGNYGSCSSHMKIIRTTYSIPCVHNWASRVAQMVKNLRAGDLGLIPRSGRSPGRREWLPTPAFLPGEFHRQGQEKGHGLEAGTQRI